jgi:hypothetical protein
MNKPSKWIIALVMLAAGAVGAGSAFAWHHGPRVSIGLGFGPYWGPYWGPGYYYPPPAYYYPPPYAVAPAAPAQYVERSDQPLQQGYWYYCETSRGYYPYVKECATGWKAVPPAPAPAQ